MLAGRLFCRCSLYSPPTYDLYLKLWYASFYKKGVTSLASATALIVVAAAMVVAAAVGGEEDDDDGAVDAVEADDAAAVIAAETALVPPKKTNKAQCTLQCYCCTRVGYRDKRVADS